MQIKQDPVTKLWCRNDGAILMPPNGKAFKTFRWTFGYKRPSGYKQIMLHGRDYYAHQIICRAFHGLAPDNKPLVDHINRIRDDNGPENLHWVSCKENNDNTGRVDQSIAKYGVRACDDQRTYYKAWYEAHCEEARTYAKAYRKRRKASQSLGVNSTMHTP